VRKPAPRINPFSVEHCLVLFDGSADCTVHLGTGGFLSNYRTWLCAGLFHHRLLIPQIINNGKDNGNHGHKQQKAEKYRESWMISRFP
jgi:hypothetical protein